MSLTINKISQEPIHWKCSELTQVLYFIDSHFDKWYNDNYNFCVKVKEAIDVNWDATSIYNKIDNLFKMMDNYLRRGETCDQSASRSIDWGNEEIYELVKKLYLKTIKRLKKDNQGIAKDNKGYGHIEKILKYGEFKYRFSLN
jgi:hypothetical protein